MMLKKFILLAKMLLLFGETLTNAAHVRRGQVAVSPEWGDKRHASERTSITKPMPTTPVRVWA